MSLRINKEETRRWYLEDSLHRLEGPAVEKNNGNKFWYKNGEYHRLEGPALEYKNGHKFWYIEGKGYTEEEFKEKKKLLENKIIDILKERN